MSVKSSTIAALKAEAMAKVKKATTPPSHDDTWHKEFFTETTPAPSAYSGWPSVLKNEGKLFSTLFREWYKDETETPDFHVPDYSGHEWPADMAAAIPAASDYVAPPHLVHRAALAYTLGSVTHLVGWPGTGKSEGLPVLLASRLGLPLLRIGLNKKGMMLDDLIGRESLVREGDHVITRHKDGVLVKWVQHPSLILLDEFARANSEIQNGLMSVMERGGKLLVENRPEGSVVPRNAGCWLIASDNVKGLGDDARMVGTELVDGAILDRFDTTLEVDYLSIEQTEKLLLQWVPGLPDADKLAKLGAAIQARYKKGTLPLSVSPRALRSIATKACVLRNYAPAYLETYVAKLAEEADIAAAKECYRDVFGVSL